MSYYTYFYPERGYNNSGNKTVNELVTRKRNSKRYMARYKALLSAKMIDAYYSDTVNLENLYDKILGYVNLYKSYKDNIDEIDWALSIESLFKDVDSGKEKEPVFAVNHFSYKSEYDLDEVIECYNNDAIVNGAVESLIVFSRIRANKDADEQEYLQSTYIDRINEIIGGINYDIEEKNRCLFYKKYWSTKKTEEDLAKEEDN